MTCGSDVRMNATDDWKAACESPRIRNAAGDLALGGYRVHSITRERLVEEELLAGAGFGPGTHQRCSSPIPISWWNASRFVRGCKRRRCAWSTTESAWIWHLCWSMDAVSPKTSTAPISFPTYASSMRAPCVFSCWVRVPAWQMQAARHLVGKLGQQVVGTCDGYAEYADAGDGLVERIDAFGCGSRAGSPSATRGRRPCNPRPFSLSCNAPVMFGVGASLDFLLRQRQACAVLGAHAAVWSGSIACRASLNACCGDTRWICCCSSGSACGQGSEQRSRKACLARHPA